MKQQKTISASEKKLQKSATELHKNTPANWYYESLKVDPLQRYWHSRRFIEAVKLIEPVEGKVLDVGCADGVFSQVILNNSRAKELIGVDILQTSINWARKHWASNPKLSFFVRDAHNLKLASQSFDAVFCMEVLEHVENPQKVLREFKRVLKKKGYGIFLVPTDNLLFRIVWYLWLHFYPRGWVWRETHIQSYQNSSLKKICQQAGFVIEKEKKFNLGMLQLIKVRKP